MKMTSTAVLRAKSQQSEQLKQPSFISVTPSLKVNNAPKLSISSTASSPSFALTNENENNNKNNSKNILIANPGTIKTKSSTSLNVPYPLIKLDSSLISGSSSSTVTTNDVNVITRLSNSIKRNSKRKKKGFNFKRQVNINDDDSLLYDDKRPSVLSLQTPVTPSLLKPKFDYDSTSLSTNTQMSRKSSYNSVR